MHTTINLTPHNPNLVGLGRFELPTSPLSGVRSNQLSYRPKLCENIFKMLLLYSVQLHSQLDLHAIHLIKKFVRALDA